jgi:diamine N-acetyltransferase
MLSLRLATPFDFPTIQRIAQLTWPSTFSDILSPSQIEYMLERMYSQPSLNEQVDIKGHVFIIAEHGQDPIGYASYEPYYNRSLISKIHKIYVLPGSQGMGAGKALIDHITYLSRATGICTLQLNVNRYNKAIEFYKREGFEIIGEEDIDIGQNYLMEDYILEKKLS